MYYSMGRIQNLESNYLSPSYPLVRQVPGLNMGQNPQGLPHPGLHSPAHAGTGPQTALRDLKPRLQHRRQVLTLYRNEIKCVSKG